MCGILGLFARSESLLTLEKLLQGLSLLHHRGPDSGGYWLEYPFFLGHRRLNTLDTKREQQPYFSPDGRYALSFDGAIYNSVQLRNELMRQGYHFRTASDTEVLIHGFDAWQQAIVHRIEGMFSFAIVDREKQSLFLARDRFGERPLFYCEADGSVLFASELLPLAQIMECKREVSELALNQYLALNYVPCENTLFKSIKKLNPGSYRWYSLTEIKQHRYWSMPQVTLQPFTGTAEVAAEKFQYHLDDAIESTLQSKTPITIMLNGSVESALIAESAARQGGIHEAFYVDVAGQNTAYLAAVAQVADRLKLKLNRISVDDSILEDSLEIAKHISDPVGDINALTHWAAARGVGKYFVKMLGSEGANELLGGHQTYLYSGNTHEWMSLLPTRIRRYLARGYNHHPFLQMGDEGPDDIFAPIFDQLQIQPPIDRYDLLRLDTNTYLPHNTLSILDRMTAAHHVQTRSPFLNHHLAAFAWSLPDQYKIRSNQTKWLLYQMAQKVYGKTLTFVQQTLPIDTWLRGRGQGWLLELLSESSLTECGWLNVPTILASRDAHLQGKQANGAKLWNLMILLAWYRQAVRPTSLLPLSHSKTNVEFVLPPSSNPFIAQHTVGRPADATKG